MSGSNVHLLGVQLNYFELHTLLTSVVAFSTTQDETWMLQSCTRNSASVHDGEMDCATLGCYRANYLTVVCQHIPPSLLCTITLAFRWRILRLQLLGEENSSEA